MSRVTPAHHPIRERLPRDQRRAKMTALAALTALAVLIATLVLVINGDDSPTAATHQPAVQAGQQPPTRRLRSREIYVQPSTGHSAGRVSR
jgi:hypothetical protein